MNEKLEQVARALAKRHFEARFGRSNPDHIQINVDGNWGIFADDARAAIAAMRVPTKAMVEAGNTALENATDSDWDSGGDGESHNSYTTIRSTAPFEIFQAMLDEALK